MGHIRNCDSSQKKKQSHGLALALSQGDEWGFLGSRRFARDVTPTGGGGAAAAADDDGEAAYSNAPVWADGCENEVTGEDTSSGLPLCLAPTVYPNLAFRSLARDHGRGGIDLTVALDQVRQGHQRRRAARV